MHCPSVGKTVQSIIMSTLPIFMLLLTNDTLPNSSFLKFGSSDIGLHEATNEILGSRNTGANKVSEFTMCLRNGCLLYSHEYITRKYIYPSLLESRINTLCNTEAFNVA